ncbi:MAG: 5'-3' exonuclease H3TH domain-containing protein [Gammaproteobacteria bacterium]|nr:5'-3' exonuclease H3TH domain-containing protein [Gammaproteobacteria bacterium]MDX2488231.1 5'-3' exonuclease H3TH domain-containing protein [Gammaproteobacteria bacterium]
MLNPLNSSWQASDMQLDGVRFLLIDGPNLIRRIHAAIPAEDNDKLIERTISSSLQSLSRALKQHTPTHALCAFECDGPTWRHASFPDYKKDRPPMPHELHEIFSRLKQEIQNNGVFTLSVAGMEADDIIASAAVKAAAAGAQVIILSTDTGQAQLLGPGIQQYNHFKQEPITEDSIQQRFSVTSGQLNDYLAMVGDKSHSLPGVPGIGAKTAARLLESYSGLEDILNAKEEIGGSIGKSLTEHRDSARLVKKLLALRTDISLGHPLRSFRYTNAEPAF